MTMSDIKRYLQQRGQAPLGDIANHFRSEPETVLGMLEHWQRKGRIGRVSSPQCSGCNKCDGAMLEVFRWVS